MRENIGGTPLAWSEAGDPTGPALLLVHGFPFNATMWAPQMASPVPGWRYIAADLPGFGASELTQPLSMDSCADALAGLLEHLQVKRAAVCGLSMGGYVTFALLRNHPALVRALILCDTRAEPDSPEARQARIDMAARVRAEGMAPLVEGMLPRLLTFASRGGTVEAGLRAMMESTAPATAAAALLAMGERPDSWPTVRSIRVPTQVVVGVDDVIMPMGEAQLLARAIPGSTFDAVPEAAHVPNLEQPARFGSILRRFLLRLSA